MKNSNVVNHFVNTDYARRTVYNTLCKTVTANPIKVMKSICKPICWVFYRKEKLKRLKYPDHLKQEFENPL